MLDKPSQLSFLSLMRSVRRMSAVPGIWTNKPDISLGLLSGLGIDMTSDEEVCTPDV
jgi:hypothetical protein